jgi:hypothetical protein
LGYTEYVFWSPVTGDYAARISMFNDRGYEFYTIIQKLDGKAYRKNRSEALDMLEEAIQSGAEPGEIVKDGGVGYGEFNGDE